MSSTPASGVRPCGVPSSTRSAPASQSSTTRSATSSGVPAMQKRSSGGGSPGSSSSVGSRCATTPRYGSTATRARSRAQSPSSSTTLTAADDDLHLRVVEPAARNGDEVGIRAAAELQLVRDRSRPARRLRPPRPDHERHRVALARIRERRSRLEREALSREAGLVAREQRGDDRDRFAERGERPLLLDAELVEPRPLREAEDTRVPPRPRRASRPGRRSRTDAA